MRALKTPYLHQVSTGSLKWEDFLLVSALGSSDIPYLRLLLQLSSFLDSLNCLVVNCRFSSQQWGWARYSSSLGLFWRRILLIKLSLVNHFPIRLPLQRRWPACCISLCAFTRWVVASLAFLLIEHLFEHPSGPIPWIYVSDIFPTRTRHYGLALASASQWLWSKLCYFPVVSILTW